MSASTFGDKVQLLMDLSYSSDILNSLDRTSFSCPLRLSEGKLECGVAVFHVNPFGIRTFTFPWWISSSDMVVELDQFYSALTPVRFYDGKNYFIYHLINSEVEGVVWFSMDELERLLDEGLIKSASSQLIAERLLRKKELFIGRMS